MVIDTESRYSSILTLQERLNRELRENFERHKDKGREFLSANIITLVEGVVERLNSSGYDFGRCDYGGDINYEYSEQSYSDGAEMGTGVILAFQGYSVQVLWEGADKYA